MRSSSCLSLVLALLTLTACATTRPSPPPSQVQTTAQANRENLQGAVQAPLRDLNMVRTKIPPVLLDAMADPYRRPPGRRCADLVALIRPLNAALGADLDVPSVDQDDLLVKGRETTLSVMATAASSALPFRGWVRQLSGAEQHDREVQAAITAGAVRRAYLKGLGESRGCTPPATPSHVLTARRQPAAAAPARPTSNRPTPPPKKPGPFKPRYPARPN